MDKKFKEKSVVCVCVSNAYTFGENIYSKGDLIIMPIERFDKEQKHLYRPASFSELIAGYCTSPRMIGRNTVAPRLTLQDFSLEQLTEFKRMVRAKAASLKLLIEKQKKEDLDLTEDSE